MACHIFVCIGGQIRLRVIACVRMRVGVRAPKRARACAVFYHCQLHVYAVVVYVALHVRARTVVIRTLRAFLQTQKERPAMVGCARRACGYDTVRGVFVLV